MALRLEPVEKVPFHSSYRDSVIGDGAVAAVVAAEDSLKAGARIE